MYRRIRRHLET